jgi:hypothetical protein
MPISHAAPAGFSQLARRLTGGWRDLAERREHDVAMLDARIAAEHAHADARATSHGQPGCRFCRR